MNLEYIESICTAVYHEQRRRELMVTIKLLALWLCCAAAVTTLMINGRIIESAALRWVIYISFTVVLVYACCGLEQQIKKSPRNSNSRRGQT